MKIGRKWKKKGVGGRGGRSAPWPRGHPQDVPAAGAGAAPGHRGGEGGPGPLLRHQAGVRHPVQPGGPPALRPGTPRGINCFIGFIGFVYRGAGVRGPPSPLQRGVPGTAGAADSQDIPYPTLFLFCSTLAYILSQNKKHGTKFISSPALLCHKTGVFIIRC